MKSILLSWRHIKNDKANSIINIVGLGIALGVFAVAMVYVDFEYSYDRCFKDSGRIYQVKSYDTILKFHLNTLGYDLSEIMRDEIPQVEDAVALGYCGELTTESSNIIISADATTSNFFKMFGIKVLEGDVTSLDHSLTSLVLTRSEAKRIFGDENHYVGRNVPVKWSLQKRHYDEDKCENIIDNTVYRKANMSVVAVIDDYPTNVTLSPRIIVSPEFAIGYNDFEEIPITSLQERLREVDCGISSNFYTYSKLRKGIDAKTFEPQLNELIRKNHNLWSNSLYFKAITENHFSKNESGRRFCESTFIIGLLILIVAFFNYVNLASATADRRLRMQAICQINGAQTGNIVWQSIVETLMLIVFSLPLSVLVVVYGLPKLCTLLDVGVELSFFGNFASIATIWAITSALFGLFSGLVIKFRLHRINLADAVKSRAIKIGDRLVLTNILTIIQIAVFCGLFASILLMDRQINYALKVDLGFDKDGLIIVEMHDGQYPVFKEEAKKMPGIIDFSGATTGLADKNKLLTWFETDTQKSYKSCIISVDDNFFNTIGVKILEGDFDGETDKFVTNQKAKEEYLWTIGQQTMFGELQGVVSNFNFENAHNEITSTIYNPIKPNRLKSVSKAFLRVNLMQTPNIVSDIEKVWKRTFPDTDFKWYFADEKLAESYQKDRNYSFVISALTIIALFIAIIGIIGLSTALNQKRVKEIGIRKVNGATTAEILTLLCRRYIWIVAVAIAISVPCAYSFVAYWLKDFAYKISITPEPFIISAIATLLIVLATVAIQSLSVARRNPVEAIKTE